MDDGLYDPGPDHVDPAAMARQAHVPDVACPDLACPDLACPDPACPDLLTCLTCVEPAWSDCALRCGAMGHGGVFWVLCAIGLCAAGAAAYYVRALHIHLDRLDLTVLAREQRVEALCAQLRTALDTGRVVGECLNAEGGGGGTTAVTLASVGGIDINLGATLQPHAAAASRWVVGAAQWLFRT